MSLPGVPLRYPAVGVADTIDATDEYPGAMASLINLVPFAGTKKYWWCRPAMAELTDFTGFTTPDFISALIVVGNRAYGMIASAAFAGRDEPFSFELSGATFDVMTGATGINTPISPPSTGSWTPPTMALVGTEIIITHPGYDGTGTQFFGVIDVSDPANPVYSSENTTGTVLPTPPTAVKNFNGRAWYLVNPNGAQPAAYFSDILAATVITAGTQILTFDDNVPLTALGALPLDNQLGGIIQSLIVFKGVSNMYQVTGDASTPGGSNLAKNALNVATGTLAPLSIATTPYGLAFLAPDGIRIIDFGAHVSDPLGIGGNGITVPLVNALEPTRVCIAANASVLRVTTQNNAAVGVPYQEYWYDIALKTWSGPHTCAASLIQRWANAFVVAPVAELHSLARSDIAQTSTTTFSEYGTDLEWDYKTAFLPDPSQMCEMCMIETTVNISFSSAIDPITCYAIDGDEAVIDSVNITLAGTPTVWGAFTWGASPWLGALTKLKPRQIPWTIPIVFRRLQLRLTGDSASGIILGDWFMRYQMLGYLQQV